MAPPPSAPASVLFIELQPQPKSSTRPDNSVRFIAVTPVDSRLAGSIFRATRPDTRRPRARGGDYAEIAPGRQDQAHSFPLARTYLQCRGQRSPGLVSATIVVKGSGNV